MTTRVNHNRPLDRQWTQWEYDALSESGFNRLCLTLLKNEISNEVQPNNKKGPDRKNDAFLLPCENKYNRDGLWWFQFKFRDFGLAVNSGRDKYLPKQFKKDFENELKKIIKRGRIPQNYIIITNVQLTGTDSSKWLPEEILKVYSSKIPFIRYWDYSQLNVLLDQYPDVKRRFEEIIFGPFLDSMSPALISRKSDKTAHILNNPQSRFVEKLNYILDLIKNLSKAKLQKYKQSFEIIRNNDTLSWHFFKNLKNPDWFPIIKDTMIQSVVKSDINSAVKYQLLNYLETCMDKYSDEIIPLLVELEDNTKNPNIIVAFIKTLTKLKPSKKENLAPIWRLLRRLTEHQHPWVRKEVPGTLKSFAEYDLSKSLELLKKLFLFNPIPRDITQGSPTLALTFQGRDNENWVFEQTVKALSQLMADHKLSIEAFNSAIKLEIELIKHSKEKLKKESGIILDCSCIWIADKDSLEKLEFNYNKHERLALEIEKNLDEIASSNMKLAKNLFIQLLKTNYEIFYLLVIRVLTRHPDQYLGLIESIVFNKKLWGVYNIRKYFLQLLVQKYFEQRQNRLSEYIQSVKSLKYKKNPEKADYLKQDLLISIPEKIRTEDVRQELKNLETRLKIPAEIEKQFSSYLHRESSQDIEVLELKAKTINELVKMMEDCTNGPARTRISRYNLYPAFSQLIKDDSARFPLLLDKMVGKGIDQRFSGEMMKSYINIRKTNPQDIIKVFGKLQKTDTWARTEVARFLKNECKKKETPKMNKGLLKEIKNVLFDLALDQDPENDETIKSSNPHPQDALTRGINSVRGVVAETLIVLLYYFPKDKEVSDKLMILIQDKTNAVKANLIYNLKFLINENYTLCKKIINQVKSKRDPEIDFALIRYFAGLDSRKFQANINFVKLLFNNPHKEIQGNLGELIGRRYIAGFKLQQLVSAIIKQQIGEKEARRSLAFVFESSLGEQIAIKKHGRIFSHLRKLLDPRIEPDPTVRERAAFVFKRNELQTQYFGILYQNKVFDPLIIDELNIRAQSHLIHYLCRCISNNESIDRCIKILHSQVMGIEGILSDPLIIKDIADILKKVLGIRTLNKRTRNLVNQIFDKGLERGWDEFYEIFTN